MDEHDLLSRRVRAARSIGDTRDAIAANRARLARDHRRAGLILAALSALSVLAIGWLLWKQAGR